MAGQRYRRHRRGGVLAALYKRPAVQTLAKFAKLQRANFGVAAVALVREASGIAADALSPLGEGRKTHAVAGGSHDYDFAPEGLC